MRLPGDGILQLFNLAVSSEVSLTPEGVDRYRVFTQFMFADGDHCSLVLKKDGVGWILSDEGNTMMHLSYRADSQEKRPGNREEMIRNLLLQHRIEDREGELISRLQGDHDGDALSRMVQGILRLERYFMHERYCSQTESPIISHTGIQDSP